MAVGEFSFAVYENGLVCALGLDYFTQTGAMTREDKNLSICFGYVLWRP